MRYKIFEAKIKVFDIHITTRSVLSTDVLNEEYAFLSTEAEYQKKYIDGIALQTERFYVKPLDRRTFLKNFFWRYYKDTLLDEGDVNYWYLQMPFVMTLKDGDIRIDSFAPDVDMKVDILVYLTAIGWMTVINIGFKGDIDLEDKFIEMVRSILDKDMSIYIYKSQRISISKLFQIISNEIKYDLYKSPENSLDRLKVAKNHVISILHASGPVNCYNDKYIFDENSELSNMSQYDKALMYSLLNGRKVTTKEFVEMESTHDSMPFSYISYDLFGLDFALIDFRKGVLVFMQNLANNKDNINTIGCLTSNVSNCLMMTLLLQRFYFDSNANQREDSSFVNLRKNIKQILLSLPDEYNNNFCRALYKKQMPFI